MANICNRIVHSGQSLICGERNDWGLGRTAATSRQAARAAAIRTFAAAVTFSAQFQMEQRAAAGRMRGACRSVAETRQICEPPSSTPPIPLSRLMKRVDDTNFIAAD
jgi:hypothetical protein